MSESDTQFMRQAIQAAEKGMNANEGGPFGCVIVKDGKIIAEGHNNVINNNDPTAHAEIMAIREACRKLNDFQLTGCTLYTSCEPCPMCLGAIYWSRPEKVYYACTKEDAENIGFDDEYIYDEIDKQAGERNIPFSILLRDEGLKLFEKWEQKDDKVPY